MESQMIESFYALIGYQVDNASAGKAEKHLGSMKERIVELGKSLAGITIAGFTLESFKEMVHQADELGNAAEGLGVSTDALQSLGYAATLSASSVEEVQNSLMFLQRNSQAAAGGSKEMLEAFKKIGISQKELKAGTLGADEMLLDLADQMTAIEDPAKRTALAIQLLGRQGAKMIPFLLNGRKGVEDLQKEFKELGIGFSKDFVHDAKEVNDNLDKMKFATQGLASAIGSAILPGLSKMLDVLFKVSANFVHFLKNTEVINAALTYGSGLFVLWGLSAIWASKATVWAMAKPLLKIAALLALFDEIFTALKGGKTVIGTWIDSWLGLGTVDSLVRSIGQGLKIIKEFGYFNGIKEAVGGLIEMSSDRSAREKRVEDLQEQLANEKDQNKKAAIALKLKKQLEYNRDVEAGIAGETPRATGRGSQAGVEVVQHGTASASAVEEGAYNTLTPFSEPVHAFTNSKGQTVTIRQENNTNVTINPKSEADPKEIARHAKRAVEDANEKAAENLRARARR